MPEIWNDVASPDLPRLMFLNSTTSNLTPAGNLTSSVWLACAGVSGSTSIVPTIDGASYTAPTIGNVICCSPFDIKRNIPATNPSTTVDRLNIISLPPPRYSPVGKGILSLLKPGSLNVPINPIFMDRLGHLKENFFLSIFASHFRLDLVTH